jgi:hypothetical protein
VSAASLPGGDDPGPAQRRRAVPVLDIGAGGGLGDGVGKQMRVTPLAGPERRQHVVADGAHLARQDEGRDAEVVRAHE